MPHIPVRRGFALAAVALLLPFVPLPADAGAGDVSDHTVLGEDGTPIFITVFRPEGATTLNPVPVVLRSHGWAGSRDREATGTVGALLDAGYGVVTFDARGHGQSGGVARVHHWDYEIRDVSRILDWIHHHLRWVKRESTGIPNDIVVGGSGGSYGGGWQLLAAARDPRLDALVPEITWHSLPQSLAPNGAVKSEWVHILYAAGTAQARLAPEIHEWYREAMLTNRLPAAAYDTFLLNSPAAHMEDIDAPTLLIQGTMDTLFNLNEAIANYDGIGADGTPVKLFTFNREHASLPTNREALRATASPCGSPTTQAIAWYDRYLRGLPVSTGPSIELAMDDGTCRRGASLGVLASERTIVIDDVVAAYHPVTMIPLDVAPGTILAGIPRLSLREFLGTAGCTTWTVYASLVAVGPDGPRILDHQVTPIREGTALAVDIPCGRTDPAARTIDLGGLGSVLREEEQLFLRIETQNEQFATNGERIPSRAFFSDVVLTLPVAS